MNLWRLPYSQFAKLRFVDYFPVTDLYSDDPDDAMELGIGLTHPEGYGPTYFASPREASGQTAEILLDFDHYCPEQEGNHLLSTLGLPLKKNMSRADVLSVLHHPVKSTPIYLEFVVGREWPYTVGCLFGDLDQLFRVWIIRKDLLDIERKRLAEGRPPAE